MRARGWVRTCYGATLLVWPGAATGLGARGHVGLAERTVVRVLGVREAGQALVCAPRPTAAVLTLGAGVDVLHAVTMLALATRSATWRRPALASMTVAAGFAAIALSDAGSSPRATGAPLRLTTDAHAPLLDHLLDLRDRCASTLIHPAEARRGLLDLLGGIR